MEVSCHSSKVLAPSGMTMDTITTLSGLKNLNSPFYSACKCSSLVNLYKVQENVLTPPMGYCRCNLPELLECFTEKTRSGNQRKSFEIPFNWTQKYQFLITCCAASVKVMPVSPRGFSGIVAACSGLIRRGISRSVLITNEETTTNDQRAGQSSETRIPQLVTAVSRTSACKGRDQITEGMKTWQEDFIKLENECIFLHSAVDLKEAQIKELTRDHAALAEKCKKHDEVMSQKDADVKRFGDEIADLKGKLKMLEEENAALKEKSVELDNLVWQKDARLRGINAHCLQIVSLVQEPNLISLSAVENSSKSSTSERKGQKRTARDYPATKSQRSKKKARQAESSDDCQVEPSSGGEEESFADISTLCHHDSDVSQNSAV